MCTSALKSDSIEIVESATMEIGMEIEVFAMYLVLAGVLCIVCGVVVAIVDLFRKY